MKTLSLAIFVVWLGCLVPSNAKAAASAQRDNYRVTTGTTLVVSSPGVLSNDSVGAGGSGLNAILVGNPSRGTLFLTNNGGFSYTPTNGFIGTDTFTYRANDNVGNSAIVAVTISVLPVGALFYDDFTRFAGADAQAPFTPVLGTWTLTGGLLTGIRTGNQEYEDFYIAGNYTNYSVQGRIQMPSGAWGGGFNGRLNSATGAKYMAVIYPEGSQGSGGLPLMRLIKFHTWNTWNANFTPMAEVSLPPVGTAWHTEKLEFRGNRVQVFFDGTQVIDVTDNNVDGLAPYTSGGFGAHMYSEFSAYTANFDDMIVSLLVPVAIADSYDAATGKPLNIGGVGVLANDLAGSGGTLTAVLATGPAHGSLTLNSNGSFSYTSVTNYLGPDSFTYRANDGTTNSAPATVSLNVVPNHPPIARPDIFNYVMNTPLTLPAPGVLASDADVDVDPLTAVLVSGTTYGSLNLNSNGSFTYIPATNCTGQDSFTYKVNDGSADSSVVTVTLQNPTQGSLFSDNFTRSSNSASVSPWVIQSGNWLITNGVMQVGSNNVSTYGSLYLTNTAANTFTNYAVQARMQFPANAFGAAVSGCLNPATGTRYGAWVYPENSPAGSNLLKLIKFKTWTSWNYQNQNFAAIQTVSLPSVGTNSHLVKLAFRGNRIAVYYDNVRMISVTDAEATPYLSGGIGIDLWTEGVPYTMMVDDVVVDPLVVDNSYSVAQNTTLNVAAPGPLFNDTEIYGTNLFAILTNSPAHGAVTLNTNGSFAYTPSNNYVGSDSFVYQARDGSTNMGNATVNLTVIPSAGIQDQSITFGSLANKTYGDAAFALSASASSGLPVSFSIFSGPATITGTNLTITGTGSVTVRASQAGNGSFNPAPDVDQSFTVNPAVLTVQADPKSKVYGTGNPALTASFNGFVNGENSGVLSGAPGLSTTAISNSPAATYPIVVTNFNLSAANYTFAFTNGTLTVTKAALVVSATGVNRSYDGTTNATVTLSDNRLAGDSLTTGYSAASFANKNAGLAKPVTVTGITVTGPSATNYTFNPSASTTANISTVTLGVTADDKNRAYGATNPPLTASYSGFAGGETLGTSGVTGSPALATAANTNSAIGTYPITAAIGSLAAVNYGFSFTNGTLTVDKAVLVVSATGVNRAYDGTTNATVTLSDNRIAGDSLTTGYTAASFTNKNAGLAKPVIVTGITVTGSSATNYTFNTNASTTANITAITLGVTADDKNRVYGVTNPPLTASYAGFVNGEVLGTSGVTGNPALATAANTNSAVGTYPITAAIGSLAAVNYGFSFTNGTLTVDKAVLVVSAHGVNRAYDGTTNATVTLSDNRIAGDSLTTGFGSASFADKNVGLTKPVSVIGITVTGPASGNYSFNTNASTTANITAVTLGVTADDKSRTYGLTNPPLTASYSGFVNGEVLGTSGVTGNPALATAANTNSAVGTYPITVAIGSLAAVNYGFSFTNGTLTVDKAVLVVSAHGVNRAYDGTTNATVTLSDNRIAGDSLTTGFGSASFADKNVGLTKPVSVIGITVSGPASGNYSFNTNASTTANITAVTLGVTADDKSRAYGLTNPPLTASYSGFVNGEVLGTSGVTGNPALATAANTNSAVGTYPITAAIGSLTAVNYGFSFTNGTLTVDKAVLVVSAHGVNRAYDGTTNATVTLSDNRIAGDSLTTGFGSASFADKNAGLTKPVSVVGITVTGPASGNYTFNTNASTTADITHATLGVTADGKSRAYGLTNPPLTASYSGFVVGETLGTSGVTGNPALATTADTNSAVGTYPITAAIGSLAAVNYGFSFTNGTLTVGKATLIVQAHDQIRGYGETNPVFAVGYSGFVGTDDTNILVGVPAVSTSATTNSPVDGSPYSIVTTNGTLSALNYAFAFANGHLTITQAVLTVTASNQSKIYGVTNPPLTASYSGFVNGENVGVISGAADLGTTALGNSPVGVYAITATNGTLTATNYSFSFVGGVLTVTPASTFITWTNPADIIYGTTLSGTQLNATGSVPGALGYSPLAGTVLNAGSAQVLSVTLIPADTNYLGATTNVFINVLKSSSMDIVSSSTNHARPGTVVTFTATLNGVISGSGKPTGDVQFDVDGVAAGSPVLLTNGVAEFSSALTHGLHDITVVYPGDNNFLGSTNSLVPEEMINTPPVAGILLLGTRENTPININRSDLLSLAHDADGDTLVVGTVSATSAGGGSVGVAGPVITYTPSTNATGSDSFTYTVTDGFGGSANGVVTIIIRAPGEPSTVPLGILANGHALMHFAGMPGRNYTVLASTDLHTWTDLGIVAADSNGSIQFEDLNTSSFPMRVYRIVPAD